MERKLVGINEFVKRQTPESGKHYSTLSYNKIAEYGIGGGIVWKSNDQDEWNEAQLKSKILQDYIN